MTQKYAYLVLDFGDGDFTAKLTKMNQDEHRALCRFREVDDEMSLSDEEYNIVVGFLPKDPLGYLTPTQIMRHITEIKFLVEIEENNENT